MTLLEVRGPTTEAALGLRANAGQFALLVAVNGLVGALVGQERTLVPLLGDRLLGVASATAVLGFIATFGLAKAAANLVAGSLADRIGRRRVLILGWLFGVPVPLGLMWAPTWGWVVALNVLLGINQGLAWSTTVIMKIDLAGPERRGLAMGLNEFAGYLALAGSAAASGLLAARFGLRPEPFLMGLAVVALGLIASVLFVEETAAHAHAGSSDERGRSLRDVAALCTYRDRALSAASRTGLVNNANDAYAWGLVPLLLLGEGLGPEQVGIVAAVYPATWATGQLVTGPLSDRIGRRIPASTGMLVQAGALLWFVLGQGLGSRVAAAALLGAGTALTYPAVLAAVADRADGSWRASALGVYRTWRDLGYVAGAFAAGLSADAFGLRWALVIVAGATALSALDSWLNLPASSSARLNVVESSHG